MVGFSAQALDRVVAKPGTQALTQLLPGLGLLGAWVEQRVVLGHESRQVIGHQAQFTHRCRNAQRLQAPARQLEEHCRITFCSQ
ncbi:hypothetical protein D3C79_803340 [compost metagenome]